MTTSSPVRVLVAENDSFWQILLRELLPRLGYTVLGPVATAAEALALQRSGPPATVALLDIGLDGKPDGVGLAKLLQASGPLPVVFLTAYTDDAHLAAARHFQPTALLHKDTDLVVHIHRLTEALALAAQTVTAGAVPAHRNSGAAS